MKQHYWFLGVFLFLAACSHRPSTEAQQFVDQKNAEIWARARKEGKSLPILKLRKKIDTGRLFGRKENIQGIFFDPTGQRLAILYLNFKDRYGLVRTFDLEKQQLISQFKVDTLLATNSLAWISWEQTGRYITFGINPAPSDKALVWDSLNGQPVFEVNLPESQFGGFAGFNLEVQHPRARPPLGLEIPGTFWADC